MRRILIVCVLAGLLSACAGMGKPRPDPAVPNDPIAPTADGGACNNNVVAEFPGRKGRGTSTIRCTKSLADVASSLKALDPDKTLLVLDIDDTLLTSPVFYGSDSWYDWTKSSGPAPAEAKPLCQFDQIALNYEAGTQVGTEKAVGVGIINGISVQKLLLTSRGANYRGGTERELRAAGYTLPSNLLSGTDGISWLVPVKDRDDAMVTYSSGILMVTGQDKGNMLLELLRRLKALKHGQKFKNVVLVDDGFKNINSLHNALPQYGFNYEGIWYRHVTKGPAAGSSDVADAIAAQKAWNSLIETFYGDRWTRWQVPAGKGCGK